MNKYNYLFFRSVKPVNCILILPITENNVLTKQKTVNILFFIDLLQFFVIKLFLLFFNFIYSPLIFESSSSIYVFFNRISFQQLLIESFVFQKVMKLSFCLVVQQFIDLIIYLMQRNHNISYQPLNSVLNSSQNFNANQKHQQYLQETNLRQIPDSPTCIQFSSAHNHEKKFHHVDLQNNLSPKSTKIPLHKFNTLNINEQKYENQGTKINNNYKVFNEQNNKTLLKQSVQIYSPCSLPHNTRLNASQFIQQTTQSPKKGQSNYQRHLQDSPQRKKTTVLKQPQNMNNYPMSKSIILTSTSNNLAHQNATEQVKINNFNAVNTKMNFNINGNFKNKNGEIKKLQKNVEQIYKEKLQLKKIQFFRKKFTGNQQMFSTHHSSKRTSYHLGSNEEDLKGQEFFSENQNFQLVMNQSPLKKSTYVPTFSIEKKRQFNQKNLSTSQSLVPKVQMKKIFTSENLNNSQNLKSQSSLQRSSSIKQPITPQRIAHNKSITKMSQIFKKDSATPKSFSGIKLFKSAIQSSPSLVNRSGISQSSPVTPSTATKTFINKISFPSPPSLNNNIPQEHQYLEADSFNIQTLISQPNNSDKITIDNFEIIQKIGKGTFGNVFLVRQKKTQFLCVLKSLSKSKIKKQNLEEHVSRQIKIQLFLQHKHLTQLYGFFDDEEKIYLVMEYMPDGSFLQSSKKRKQNQVAGLLRQVCSGLAYMHQENVIHRDIKPQNILMNQGYLKIGDFGCAVYSQSKRNTLVGCLAYISPEQMSETPYDDKIDVWSVGILAYELLLGKSPFEDQIKQKGSTKYKQQKFPEIAFPKQCELSNQAKDFVIKLLVTNPMQRLSIKQTLKHKFLRIGL